MFSLFNSGILFLPVSDKKEADKAVVAAENQVVPPVKKEPPAKPKKAPVKPLPEMMEEDVIPSLRATLEAQEDISQIEISFQENRVTSLIQIHFFANLL